MVVFLTLIYEGFGLNILKAIIAIWKKTRSKGHNQKLDSSAIRTRA